MAAPTTPTKTQILHQPILGSRRFSNYWWATVVPLGGAGFFLAALSSYFHVRFLPFTDTTGLIFYPQGLAIGFYGVAALLLGAYLWLLIACDVGGGYNEFNKETGEVRIFRWGLPGKNRQVEFTSRLEDIQTVRVQIKDGLNPRRCLYLRLKGRPDIPLTRVGQPLPLSEIENQAAQLARFLEVPLEGL
jgi:hypothetical protein